MSFTIFLRGMTVTCGVWNLQLSSLWLLQIILIITNRTLFTTTLYSFADGLILSVTAMNSVGKNNTDRVTDGSRPSVQQSSVNPISVANSVANKKNHPPTEIPTDTRVPKKSFPREHYRRNTSVGNFKGNYRRHYRRKTCR